LGGCNGSGPQEEGDGAGSSAEPRAAEKAAEPAQTSGKPESEQQTGDAETTTTDKPEPVAPKKVERNEKLETWQYGGSVFQAVSAFKGRSVKEVAGGIIKYVEKYGVSCKATVPADPEKDYEEHYDEDTDVLVLPLDTGWTVVWWMDKSSNHDQITAHLSAELKTIAAAAHVHDGDYWAHAFFDSSRLVDLFCSIPNYFTRDKDEVKRLAAKYAGNAKAIAVLFLVPEETVSPYLVHHTPESREKKDKAYPDDEFELADCWVFVDLWRRLGIGYPAGPIFYKQRLRFDGDFDHLLKKLPSSGDFEM
jgi:hypothetical protein